LSIQPLALTLELVPTDAGDTSWHLDLPETGADLGVLRVGPGRLAERLAMLLGRPATIASTGERIAATMALLAELDDGDQWFSVTRKADPIGAANWMLAAHDELRLLGWDGRTLEGSDRLRALSLLRDRTGANRVPPGSADVLHDLLGALEGWTPPVALRVRLQRPRETYAPVVRRILRALQGAGAEVAEPPEAAPAAPAGTDLGRLQRALLGTQQPGPLTGDGSLRVLEGETPWEAAAHAVATLDDTGLWLVSGEAEVLGRVRSQVGRPHLGSAAASRWRPVLQVLPLVVALQYAPQDPQLALELLTLPVDVTGLALPRRISRALVDALREAPAVGGPLWSTALDESIRAHGEAYPDADLAKLRARISAWFPSHPAETVSPAALAVVADTVAQWLRARGGQSSQPTLRAAAAVAADFALSLRRLPPGLPLTSLQAGQLYEVAVGSGIGAEREPEAGAPASTSAADTVPKEVDRLVWFGLVAGNAEQARATAWTTSEQHALAAAGVDDLAAGARRRLEQEAWVRAVAATRESLVLVTWQGAGGEASEPHPLLDLWAARLGERSIGRVTTRAADVLSDPDNDAVRVLEAVERPHTEGTIRVPAGTISTERTAATKQAWSASSIETLITCPLRWTLRYAGGLRAGPATELWELRALSGTFAHSLFEQVLFEDDLDWDGLTPAAAAASIAARFDQQVSLEAAPLTFPRHEATRRRLRTQVQQAVGTLVEQLKAGGWQPLAPERPLAHYQATLEGQSLSGNIDLLVERHDGTVAIIDLKLGGGSYQEGSLREGTALQLAVYAKAAGSAGEALPPTAYFIIEEGALLTTDVDAFPAATHVTGPTPGQTVLDAVRAWTDARELVEAGLVFATREEATARPDPDEVAATLGRAPAEHPWTDSKPPCRFCEAKRLCSLTVLGGAA
jgi:RecB family exonuclease